MTRASIPNFRHLDVAERQRRLSELLGLDAAEISSALEHGLDLATANRMVENAVGTFGLPLGVAFHFRVNERDYIVPMATEEPSVIAAASHAAKRVRAGGGFFAESDAAIMAAQIEVHGVSSPEEAKENVLAARAALLEAADRESASLRERGGGARDIEFRYLGEGMVVVHVTVDCCDAMGANVVNSLAESLGPRVAELCGGELGLRILTNYCDRRCTRVRARLPVEALGGRAAAGDHLDGLEVARGIARASRFAELDPYRAATHNKGIMNGLDAVVVATGNDWRAVEAGAHAHAARGGSYGPLATWRLSEDERTLEGAIEVPLALGIVGGALRAHEGARACVSILGVESAAELANVATSAGLATNLAALRALATEGIQRGHMTLHRRTLSPPPGEPDRGSSR